MRGMERISRRGRIAALVAGLGALVVTVGCSGRESSTAFAQQPAASAQGTPFVVSCEPHQRALVRPSVVNGAAVSQVECVTDAALAAALPASSAAQPVYAPAAQPVYAPAPAPRRSAPPVYAELEDTRVVSPSGAARPVRTRQVIYEEERPVKKTRSIKKSAIIIGSSAGAGAGVGAAMGGKKGALIGAAIGGGGAAVWDQVTRRK